MPAIATTTSCVSGLVAIELIKIVAGETRLERFKNSFMNLALPLFVLSEPQEAEKKKISDHLSITLWDSWEVRDRSTLQQLIDYFDVKKKTSRRALPTLTPPLIVGKVSAERDGRHQWRHHGLHELLAHAQETQSQEVRRRP